MKKTRGDNFVLSCLAVNDMKLNEKRPDRENLVVNCSLVGQNTIVISQALKDFKAFEFAFIYERLAHLHNFHIF